MYVDRSEIGVLVKNPDAAVLLLLLRSEHYGLRDEFAIAPAAMAKGCVIPGWNERRIRTARDYLLEAGRLVLTHAGGAGRGDPSRFGFPSEGVQFQPYNTNKAPRRLKWI